VGPVELGKTAEPIPLVNLASAGKPGQDVHTTWLREISRLTVTVPMMRKRSKKKACQKSRAG